MEKSQLEEIKAKVDVVDLIAGYVALTKAGKNYKALCPFHNEDTPSFMVSPELQIFKCFGCGVSGDIYKFVEEIESVDFLQAVKILADRAGVRVTVKEKPEHKDRRDTILEINHRASEYYHFLLTKHEIGEKALKYFKDKRSLTDDTIKNFTLGYAPNSWRSLSDYLISKKFRIGDVIAAGLAIPSESGYYDRFRARVVFPIRDFGGHVVGFSARILVEDKDSPKYVNTPETEVFHKGKVLYGLDRAKASVKREKLAVLVEGQMDAISAHQAGFTNVIATGGTSLTIEQLTMLKKLTPDMAFCFDTDFAGVEAAKRGIELAEGLGMNLRVVLVPKPYKDLDECVREDPKAFIEAMENSVPLYDFYFVAAFSQNNVSDPIGQKKIAEALVPVIQKIRNPIQKEHYVKKLAKDLDTSEESVLKMLSAPGAVAVVSIGKELATAQYSEVSLQEYLLSLILKAPLDIAQSNLYKLGARDFTDAELVDLFAELKDYLLGRKKKLEIRFFSARLREELAKRLQALYLKDFDNLDENEDWIRSELTAVLKRVKTESVRRELKTLAGKIKEAESLGDTAELKKLSEQFKEVSERLV